MNFKIETVEKINVIKGQYATAQGCILPALYVLEEHEGQVTPEREKALAHLLDVPTYQVAEALSFYTMYNRHGRGKHHFQLCRNISCYLRGSDEVIALFQKRLGILPGEVSADGKYELELAECLGNCDHAPAGILGKEDINDLNCDKLNALLDKLGAPHGV